MTDGPREVVFLDDGPEPGPAEELPAPAPGSRRSRVAVLAGAALVIAGGVALARSTGGGRGPSPSPAASASAPRLGVTPAARPIPLPTHVNGTLNEAQDDTPSLQLVHLPLCPAAPCVVQTDVPASVRRHVLR